WPGGHAASRAASGARPSREHRNPPRGVVPILTSSMAPPPPTTSRAPSIVPRTDRVPQALVGHGRSAGRVSRRPYLEDGGEVVALRQTNSGINSTQDRVHTGTLGVEETDA